MEMPTALYNIFPSKKREELISKRNVRIIKEYLKKREKLKNAKKDDANHLKQLRKTKSISSSNYQRLKKVLIYSNEEKRINLIKATIEKSIKIGTPVKSYYN